MGDDFYIGYEPDMPAGLASRIRLVAIAVVVLAAAASGVLVLAQGRFADGTFEYGRLRVFEGRLIESPYPALLVSDLPAAATPYWLVGLGKHGATELTRGRDGQLVRITGSLIERDDDRMIEVHSLDFVAGSKAQPLEPLRSLGSMAMRGEIVDSKCHLGVMKPGEGPTHRDCAVRCLLGRITPMFVGRRIPKTSGARPQGSEGLRLNDLTAIRRLALVDLDGGPFSAPLETFVGRPISIRGELLARGPLRFLATTPASIQVENAASFLNVASTH